MFYCPKFFAWNFTDEAQHNFTEIKKFMKFPTDEDLTGAAAALIRLQDTYDMDTSSLARGELLGVKYTSQLSGKDWRKELNFPKIP